MYQAPGYFEQNADSVSVVDDRFATEPMTTVQPAEQQVSEEELHRFFEQAISDRVQAISACLKCVSGPLTHQPHTTGDGEGLVPARSYLSPRQGSSTFGSVLVPLAGTRDAGMWPSLLSKTWQRGIILVSLALLLLMSGFDLMGLLVLHMR
jgi:hypothetical protein